MIRIIAAVTLLFTWVIASGQEANELDAFVIDALETFQSASTKRSSPYPSMVRKHDPFHDWLFPAGADTCDLPQDRLADFATKVKLLSTKELGTGYVEAVFQITSLDLIEQTKVINHFRFASTVFYGAEPVINEGECFLEWKLGLDVPANCFDFKAKDPKESLADLFGFDYDIYDEHGIVRYARNERKLPKELAQ